VAACIGLSSPNSCRKSTVTRHMRGEIGNWGTGRQVKPYRFHSSITKDLGVVEARSSGAKLLALQKILSFPG
jgi:hypothetical protein